MVCHGAGGDGVGGEVGGLRIAGEGDGFGGWGAIVERVPDFFGDERHKGREEAEGGLEDAGEGGESEGGGWIELRRLPKMVRS